MANQTHAPVASKPFALICSYRVPTTEVNPDFIPSVSVCMGTFATAEEVKQARALINHSALISASLYQSFVGEASDALGGV